MINLNELETELKRMSARSKLFAIVKAEMQTRGYWKNKARGNGFKTGHDPRRGQL